MNKINPGTLQTIIKTPRVRQELARQSHFWFFHIYLSHYVKYPTAPFQREMFRLTEDATKRNIAIVAFRGSAKSTIMNLSYPIWAILGKQQKKFILILGQTQEQARQHLKNLKEELENNDLLRADLGPFEEREDEWRSYALVLPKYGARIVAASSEQSVRGIRHGPYRPDLIICDDIEDLASVKTRENRDKTYEWLTGEVMPAGDQRTQTVIVGNMLHEDSLIMRIRQNIADGALEGTYREYPLTDEAGNCAWPGKYPNHESLQEEKRRIGSEAAWQREYLLNIVTDHDRVVYPDWIHYYDKLPENPELHCQLIAIGIDLAISKNSSADYTAMVIGKVIGMGKERKIYILPSPVNERLSYLESLERARRLADIFTTDQIRTRLYVENVAYQQAFIEQLQDDGYLAEEFLTHGQDKRARLATATHLIQNGVILFPRKGAERLIQQLLGFGLEKHDDLADAFAILILKLMEERSSSIEGLNLFPSVRQTIFSGNIRRKSF